MCLIRYFNSVQFPVSFTWLLYSLIFSTTLTVHQLVWWIWWDASILRPPCSFTCLFGKHKAGRAQPLPFHVPTWKACGNELPGLTSDQRF